MTAPLTKAEYDALCTRTRVFVSSVCQNRKLDASGVKRVAGDTSWSVQPDLSFLTSEEVEHLRTVDAAPW